MEMAVDVKAFRFPISFTFFAEASKSLYAG
jgi:hypothetical protein